MDRNIIRVRVFHKAFRHPIRYEPTLNCEELKNLRMRLLREELNELQDALWESDPVATLDALTDLQYVLDGTYVALGFARFKEAANIEVHFSNMSKLGADGKPIYDAGGKVVKGPNYTPPNLKKILES